MLPTLLNSTPAWVLPGAKYDFDFANNRYHGGTIWLGSGFSTQNRYPSFMLDNDGGPAASTLFTQWRDGILRTNPIQTAVRRSDYGVWCEGSAVTSRNYALWCRDLTNAVWSKNNVTPVKNQTGATATANSATLLTADANNGTVTQTLAFNSVLVTTSFWVKRVSGSGPVYLSSDNSTFTDISSQINSTTWKQVRIPSQTLTNPTVAIKLGTSGDSIAVDFFQTEPGDAATSPILTNGSVNVRGPEMLSFGTPGSSVNAGLNILQDLFYGTPVSFLFMYSGNFSTTANHLLWGSDASGGAGGLPFIQGTSAGVITVTCAGNSLSSVDTDVSGLFTLNKVAVRIDGDGAAVCVNGGQITKSSSVKFQPSAQVVTHGGILNNGSNLLPSNGYMARMAGWKKGIDDGEMVRYSTLIPGES